MIEIAVGYLSLRWEERYLVAYWINEGDAEGWEIGRLAAVALQTQPDIDAYIAMMQGVIERLFEERSGETLSWDGPERLRGAVAT